MFILTLKSTKIRFWLGLFPDPVGGAYMVSPDHLAGFKGPTCKGKEEKEDRFCGSKNSLEYAPTICTSLPI